MAVILGVLAVGIVLAIAWWAVTRESRRLAAMPPQPTFQFDDALEWVVEKLPEEPASSLSVEDVKLILDLQLEYFRLKGVSGRDPGDVVSDVVVIGGPETVAHIVKRAADRGSSFTAAEVDAVLSTQMDYLRSIGAIGARADDEL